MVSRQMEKIIKQFKNWQATSKENTLEGFRKALDIMAGFAKIPKDVNIKPIKIDGVQAECITTLDIIKDNIILYFHGGGYIGGSIKNSREFCSRLSRMSNSCVLNVEYRLAPEYHFPAALEDSINAYNWLLTTGVLPEHIIMGGDSAGGGLIISTMVKLRNSGKKLPAAAFCLSPWVDLALKGDSMRTKQNSDPMVSKEGLEFARDFYLNDVEPLNPLASPLYANLKGLPPLFIQVGSSEILLDDSIRLAQQANSDRVTVELKIWKDMIHVFGMLGSNIPEVQQANEELVGFIKQYLR